MNTPTQITLKDFRSRLDDAYLLLDAAMPTVLDTVEHLGNTDEARTFWLVQKALEDVHAKLQALLCDCTVSA